MFIDLTAHIYCTLDVKWNVFEELRVCILSYLFTSFSQFLENQGFLASVSSDNEIQVLYEVIKVLLTFYDQALSTWVYDDYFFPFGIHQFS
jgi:hypothetical protein